MVTLTNEQKDLISNFAQSYTNLDKEMNRLRDLEGIEGETVQAMLEALDEAERSVHGD